MVHALATAFGTRRWPTRIVRSSHRTCAQVVANAAVPPAGLGITIHRGGLREMELRFDPDTEPYASFLKSAIVDQNLTRKISGVGECTLGTGSFVQYELPFQLQVTAFSFGFSTCGAERFLDWAFEAFDGEEWRRLLHSRTSPWPGGFYLGGDGAVVFQLWYPFASTRFRIRLLEPALSMHAHRCMHIRGLELYGMIMPPWRID